MGQAFFFLGFKSMKLNKIQQPSSQLPFTLGCEHYSFCLLQSQVWSGLGIYPAALVLMMLLSTLVVLWRGLDWVLLASLDYNRSDAHFTNEQLSTHHTVFVPWMVLNSARCQKSLLPWGSTSWSLALLCNIALVNWRATKNKGGCNNGELEKYKPSVGEPEMTVQLWRCLKIHLSSSRFSEAILIQRVQHVASGVLRFNVTIAVGHVTCCLSLFASV